MATPSRLKLALVFVLLAACQRDDKITVQADTATTVGSAARQDTGCRLRERFATPHYEETGTSLSNYRVDPAPEDLVARMTTEEVRRAADWRGAVDSQTVGFGLFTGTIGSTVDAHLVSTSVANEPAWVVMTVGEVTPAMGPPRPEPRTTPQTARGFRLQVIRDRDGESIAAVREQGGDAPAVPVGSCSSDRPAPEPPDAASPAAGICAPAEGATGNVSLGPDDANVPSPRCLVIRSSQRLSVTNNRDAPFTATIGRYRATVAAGDTHTFPEPVGAYLAPGVHRLRFTPPGTAADIWVDPVCKGPGATECVTPTT